MNVYVTFFGSVIILALIMFSYGQIVRAVLRIKSTIGQRKGLGIALGARAFITDIDPETNKITLSFSADERSNFTVSDVIFSGIEPNSEGEISDFYVKVRYQAAPVFARVEFLSDRRAKVSLSLPARSVTAGQSAVFYLGDTLAFGGFID